MKTALITGVTGQTGSYLAELLLAENYEVVGLRRRSSTPNVSRVAHLLQHPRFRLVEGDLCDALGLSRLLAEYEPDECYNLAAQSFIPTSFENPSWTWQVTAHGALNLLEVIRGMPEGRRPRFYQASSSEMFGRAWSLELNCRLDFTDRMPTAAESDRAFQDEKTPFCPQSPYAIAKLAAHHTTRLYREAYGLFACSGILFNHTSPRRGENFVTRKVSRYVGRLLRGQPVGKLHLGNLDARRDWLAAQDAARAMWLMLQNSRPADFVVASGQTHSIRELVETAFAAAGIADPWSHIEVDPALLRPAEVPYLRGRAALVRETLGWRPTMTFADVVQHMVAADAVLAQKESRDCGGCG